MSKYGSIDIISPRVAFLGDTRLLTIGNIHLYYYLSLSMINITMNKCNRSRWGSVTVGRLLKIFFYTATKNHFSKWFLMNIITLRKMKQFLPYSLQSADILFSSRHRQIIFVFSYYLCREFSGRFCPRF